MHNPPSSSPRSAYPLPSLLDGHRFALLLRHVGQSLPVHGFPVLEQEADALRLRDALYGFLLDHPGATDLSAGESYPLPPREGDDLRIVSLVGSVGDSLAGYGFPSIRSVADHVRLSAALLGFLYQPKQAQR